MAVAIWDHHPTAQELIDARLNQGWQPTTSNLRDGQIVLGYAACLMTDRI